jgi:hypothetical protein
VTLIVSFISEEFVALVSDRRITWQIGGASTKWEDTENKAVVLAGHFLMGYTGFARLGGVKTEQWVVQKLVEVDPGSYFSAMATEAELAVRHMKQPLERSGHAFVAVGYGRFRADPDALHALCITVSNALGDGEYGRWDPAPQFSVERTPVLSGPDDFRLNAFGTVPPRQIVEELVDPIQHYRRDHPVSVLGVLMLLVDLVRRVAAADDRVSKDVSVSVLPRAAVPADAVRTPVVSGLVSDPIDGLTCMFVPEGTNPQGPAVYAPATVGPGMATHGGEVWNTKPPWWKH